MEPQHIEAKPVSTDKSADVLGQQLQEAFGGLTIAILQEMRLPRYRLTADNVSMLRWYIESEGQNTQVIPQAQAAFHKAQAIIEQMAVLTTVSAREQDVILRPSHPDATLQEAAAHSTILPNFGSAQNSPFREVGCALYEPLEIRIDDISNGQSIKNAHVVVLYTIRQGEIFVLPRPSNPYVIASPNPDRPSQYLLVKPPANGAWVPE